MKHVIAKEDAKVPEGREEPLAEEGERGDMGPSGGDVPYRMKRVSSGVFSDYTTYYDEEGDERKDHELTYIWEVTIMRDESLYRKWSSIHHGPKSRKRVHVAFFPASKDNNFEDVLKITSCGCHILSPDCKGSPLTTFYGRILECTQFYTATGDEIEKEYCLNALEAFNDDLDERWASLHKEGRDVHCIVDSPWDNPVIMALARSRNELFPIKVGEKFIDTGDKHQ